MRLHRRMVDQDVDPAKIVLHLLDQVLGADLLGHIFDIRFGPPASSEDMIDDLLDVDWGNIIRSNDCTLCSKGLGQQLPTSPAGTGDQHNFIP